MTFIVVGVLGGVAVLAVATAGLLVQRRALRESLEQFRLRPINLMWNPVPFVDIVVEFLAGTRVNKDGESASSSQIQSGWTLKF